MNDAVEDGVSEHSCTPIRSCQRSTGTWLVMMSEPLRSAILDDFEQIARLIGAWEPGVPESSRMSSLTRARERRSLAAARIPMGDGQIGEEPGHAGVKDGHVLSASLVAETAS